MFIYIIIIFILFSIVNGQKLDKSRSVWVEQGLVRGQIYRIASKQIQIFRGIPYAEPPIKNLRFKKPIKKSRWEREYSAIEYGPPCIQFMDFHKSDRYAGVNMKRESEDCLYLNIFSPYNNEDESKLHPILVWIHGGSFHAGSADTGIDMESVAKNIVFHGVTLVTINYRLGPLGFMSINYGNYVEGNFGVYDMVLALEWIQQNIKQFNGDPSKVTVMGESAGSAAVSVLAVSPITKDLIHQAITLSGSSLAQWAIHRSGPSNYEMSNIADYIRCNKLIGEHDVAEFLKTELVESGEEKVKKCNLQTVIPDCLTNGEELNTISMFKCFQNEVFFNDSNFRKIIANELGVSRMVVDGYLITDNSYNFILDNARIPLLAGVAKREWAHKKGHWYNLIQLTNITKEAVEDRVRRTIDENFKLGLTHKIANSTIALIANATMLKYMDGINFSYSVDNIVRKLQEIEADIDFVAPCQAEIDAYAEKNISVFAYSFDYVPQGAIIEEGIKLYPALSNKTQIKVRRNHTSTSEQPLEAFHGLDHSFIFTQGYSANFQIEPFTKRDKAMNKLLTKMLTNFVKTGNPSTEKFNWLPFKTNEKSYTSINIPLKKIHGDIHWPTPSFWNKEAKMLAEYVKKESKVVDEPLTALNIEERIQLNAYRRAWVALWVFVIVVALLIWLCIICIFFNKSRHGIFTSRPYDNIIINH
ncbi:Carboxylesterase, type B domain-containing protein [Strongyloides ratti]|uniref:Carboxylesterase, type B domain-containing protein n=1 Tax=Strongyloides ratti TaxID=34506 RepID=A0A090LJG9_STRRB|nr:Carboxylesterase, type B domain-containing protein [Strongyloides ratti]CEF69982.1 Carboxylesterase, type B domain-containing protein [Strongyloides ratti]